MEPMVANGLAQVALSCIIIVVCLLIINLLIRIHQNYHLSWGLKLLQQVLGLVSMIIALGGSIWGIIFLGLLAFHVIVTALEPLAPILIFLNVVAAYASIYFMYHFFRKLFSILESDPVISAPIKQ